MNRELESRVSNLLVEQFPKSSEQDSALVNEVSQLCCPTLCSFIDKKTTKHIKHLKVPIHKTIDIILNNSNIVHKQNHLLSSSSKSIMSAAVFSA